MRIFADHCVPKSFVEALRQNGFQVERAWNVGMHKATDEKIFDYALANSQVLFTFDHDFTNIIRFNIPASHGVIVFDVDELSRETIQRRILEFFQGISAKRLKGTLFVIDLAGRIRTFPKK